MSCEDQCLSPARLVAQGKGEDKVHLTPQPGEVHQLLVFLGIFFPIHQNCKIGIVTAETIVSAQAVAIPPCGGSGVSSVTPGCVTHRGTGSPSSLCGRPPSGVPARVLPPERLALVSHHRAQPSGEEAPCSIFTSLPLRNLLFYSSAL